MSDLNLTEQLLAWVVVYGSPMVAGALLLGALGLPVPGTLIVIATGAFIRQGILDTYTTPPLGLGGALIGDIAVYGVGRFARTWRKREWASAWRWI